MEIKVENLTLNNEKRILCISDIHGNFLYLSGLLKKVHYQMNEDYLVILGDSIEKGSNSLKVLRFLMTLKNCFVLMGNCEYTVNQLFLKKKEALNFLKPLLSDPSLKSIVKEMIEEAAINTSLKEEEIVDALLSYFPEDIHYMLNLPHIFEHEKIRFVHAGTLHDEISKNNLHDILCLRFFDTQCLGLEKYCMVGHLPTVNYSYCIANFNPLIDKEKKIISIDGGNIVTAYGQLNCFIIDSLSSFTFSYVSYEKVPMLTVPFSQEASEESFYLSFNEAKVEIIETIDDHTYLVKAKEYVFAIDKKDIFEYHNELYAFDYTNYYLPVQKLDKVYLYKQTPYAYLVKKDGILGWIKKKELL